MDKTIKSIICDGCKEEMIEHSSYPAEYGLVLSCKDFNVNKSGTVFSVIVYPIIERDHHFCGLKCLKEWVRDLDE